MLKLRTTLPADVPDLQRIAIETQVDTFGEFNSPANMQAYLNEAYSLDNLRRELDESGSYNILAFLDGVLAGFLRMRRTSEVEYLLGKNTLELQRLYAATKYHGKGVGAALMHRCLDIARTEAVDWIWLGVWERNFKAQEFYRRWEFERFSEHVFKMGEDPQTDWLLKRRP